MMSISEKGPTGYFLKVDRESPDELHELHNNYPLAPEKLAVSSDKYCNTYYNKYCNTVINTVIL